MGINDKSYSLDNIYDMIGERKRQNYYKIKRNGAEQILQGKIKLPYEEKEALNATDATKKTLRTAWLKVKTKNSYQIPI
jgi:hypothetical protein